MKPRKPIIKKFKKSTYNICINYYKNQSEYNRLRLIDNLKRWARLEPSTDAYAYEDYTGEPLELIMYCSDRMNSGRAKAILTLFKMEE